MLFSTIMISRGHHRIYRFCYWLLLLCCLLQLAAPAFSHTLSACPICQTSPDCDHTDQNNDADSEDDELAVLVPFWSFSVRIRTVLPQFSPSRFTSVYHTLFLPPE